MCCFRLHFSDFNVLFFQKNNKLVAVYFEKIPPPPPRISKLKGPYPKVQDINLMINKRPIFYNLPLCHLCMCLYLVNGKLAPVNKTYVLILGVVFSKG